MPRLSSLMLSSCSYHPTANIPTSPSSPSTRIRVSIKIPKCCKPARYSMAADLRLAAPVMTGFGWDEVAQEVEREDDDPSDLGGYFHKIWNCNRGSELRTQFIPFVIEDEAVGHIHECFAHHLIKFEDVFTFSLGKARCADSQCVTLHPSLKTPDIRTRAVGDVIKCLGNHIPGIRNELYPVTSGFGKRTFFSLERAAAPYFGIKAYAVHVNGYVVKSGKKFLWVGKRSHLKQTYPGMLDQLVAGGLPFGITCKENLVKECEEEAGIPRFIAERAVPVGALSCVDTEGYRFKRDVLFCYDLELPVDFVPKNEDGEVDSFKLIPAVHVANIIRRTEFFMPNCSLVILDFLFRHGFISPDEFGYLQLLQSLRSGNCS